MMTAGEHEEIRCQFCKKASPCSAWDDDCCPHCGERYEPTLAQETDEC